MTLDEFVAHVHSEPAWSEERIVSVPGPGLLAEVHAKGGMLLTDFLNHPDRTRERRLLRKGHLLGPGLTAHEIDNCTARWPQHSLPEDLRALLLRVDGIHLWANLDEGRSYFGLAPLREWTDAAAAPWAAMFETLPRASLVLSYHQNGDGYLLLDTSANRYAWYDLGNFPHPEAIGDRVSDVLDWLWRERVIFDPHRTPPPAA